MLVDHEIQKEIDNGVIVIKPFDKNCINTNSYDVHLSDEIGVYEDDVLDVKKKSKLLLTKIPDSGMVLLPGTLYISSTAEYTETMEHVPCLHGKSSTGRLGINIHQTSDIGNIGFKGTWTLEISVISKVRIYAGMPIGQIVYFRANKPLVTYDKKPDAHYRDQIEPRGSEMHNSFFQKDKT
jgi:dCTP deaminase